MALPGEPKSLEASGFSGIHPGCELAFASVVPRFTRTVIERRPCDPLRLEWTPSRGLRKVTKRDGPCPLADRLETDRRVGSSSLQMTARSGSENPLTCVTCRVLTVTVKPAEHACSMEHRNRVIDARLVINSEFITANFVICAVRDTYGTQENGHHAVVAGDPTARAGVAVYEHCDLRLIQFRGPFFGFSVRSFLPDIRSPLIRPRCPNANPTV